MDERDEIEIWGSQNQKSLLKKVLKDYIQDIDQIPKSNREKQIQNQLKFIIEERSILEDL